MFSRVLNLNQASNKISNRPQNFHIFFLVLDKEIKQMVGRILENIRFCILSGFLYKTGIYSSHMTVLKVFSLRECGKVGK